MGGRIDCYVDIASFYSYIIFLDLLRNRDLLKAHSITVEFHPFLLGAVNAGSGNKPPWTLPAKATYGLHDAKRTIARFPNLPIQFPADLMSVALTVLPLRALHFIKRTYPDPEVFITTLHYFFHAFWAPPNVNLTRAENVKMVLEQVPAGFKGAGDAGEEKLFSKDEVEAILKGAGSQEMKDLLKGTTQKALDQGAFGAPWLWVTNEGGKSEPFFGSDRFHFVYQFLGLPFQNVALLPPANQSKL
ncbi:thioredoxin-like protein [Cercophora newfieldiana]|uniref:Glutathione S-transferase kappa 1 n=1 Tax=Cercophora newfieldiana TaxID=92897 RepID=A0AA40CPE1_9PEZI|nr:thioredoxin-like protein [Cercophora newfieldiana]